MPRNMTTAMAAAIGGGYIQPALFVMATFRTGPIYVWTGTGSIAWGGHTWLGVGKLGSVSTIEEGTSVEARGITLGLNGIDTALLTDVLTEFQLSAPVAVYLGLFDVSASTPTLIADPVTSWVGRMDQPQIDVSAETARITIACENRLLDMNVGVYRRYTSDDQQLDHPGDLGMEFVNGLQTASINWGRVPSTVNNG